VTHTGPAVAARSIGDTMVFGFVAAAHARTPQSSYQS
jgi:hypothetical protein